MKILLIAACLSFFAVAAQANDTAVEISVGGLKLRNERSVLMEKERLFISKELVKVEYEFRNTSNQPIISEVAFPIPAFKYDYEDRGGRDFSNFKAWIDGKPIQVEKEVRAFVKDREVTEELRHAGITIENFGNFDPSDNSNKIKTLKTDVRNNLVRIGALSTDEAENSQYFWPEWENIIKYHWRQKFPPGAIVHIKHEYRPVYGYNPPLVQNLKKEISDACIDKDLIREIEKRVANGDSGHTHVLKAYWVSYILTTANTWQTPIKDFELVAQGEEDELISFCWEGMIEKTGNAQYKARKTDFIPSRDLKIYFLSNF